LRGQNHCPPDQASRPQVVLSATELASIHHKSDASSLLWCLLPHVNPMVRVPIARCSRRHIDGATVALAIYAVICCAVTVCLALGLYELMQPRRIANPGLAAYKPPPGTIINLVNQSCRSGATCAPARDHNRIDRAARRSARTSA
jgi:hypothetical protein